MVVVQLLEEQEVSDGGRHGQLLKVVVQVVAQVVPYPLPARGPQRHDVAGVAPPVVQVGLAEESLGLGLGQALAQVLVVVACEDEELEDLDLLLGEGQSHGARLLGQRLGAPEGVSLAVGPQKELHHLQATVGDGVPQGGALLGVEEVDVGPGLHQVRDAVRVSLEGQKVQRRAPRVVLGQVDLAAARRREGSHHVGQALGGRHQQRGAAVRVRHVDVGARLQQEVDPGGGLAGVVQRRASGRVLHVHRALRLQQQLSTEVCGVTSEAGVTVYTAFSKIWDGS